MVGEVIRSECSGTYEVIEKAGEGATCTVYRVRQESVEMDRALKLLREDYMDDEAAVESFTREVRRLAAVTHTNVVKIVDAGNWDGRPFYVMEWIDGGDLREYLSEHVADELPTDDFIDVLIHILRGLEHLHKNGLVHMDVKEANIMVDGDVPKICDIGFALDTTSSGTKVRTTVEYLDPAWLNQQRNARREGQDDHMYIWVTDRASLVPLRDLYAFGRILEFLKMDNLIPDEFATGSHAEVYDKICETLTQGDEAAREYKDCEQVIRALEKLKSTYVPVAGLPELGPHGDTPAIRLGEPFDVEAVTPRFRLLIEHPMVRRLRNVKQLGLAFWVYPGAHHTRFEHSLGCYAVVVKYISSLMANRTFRMTYDSQALRTVLVAALLHDVGQYPYAHAIETVPGRHAIKRHEDYSTAVIYEKAYHEELADMYSLADLMEQEWDVDVSEVEALIGRGQPEDPELQLLKSLIDGPLDADKVDYLVRDSYYTGVPSGRNFDVSRLIASLTLNEEQMRLAVREEGLVPSIQMTLSRVSMFIDVYWQHTLRTLERMMQEVFERYEDSDACDEEELHQAAHSMSDERFRQWLAESGPEASAAIIERLEARRLYRRIRTYEPEWPETRQRKIYNGLEEVARTRETRRMVEAALARILGCMPEDGAPGVMLDMPDPGRHGFEPFDVEYRTEVRWQKHCRSVTEVSDVVRQAEQDFNRNARKIRIVVERQCADRGKWSWEEVDGAVEDALKTIP